MKLILSCVWLFGTPWTVAFQALLSMGFPRQEYWSGLPFPPPGDLPDQGIKLMCPVSPALAGRFLTTEPTGKPLSWLLWCSQRLSCLTLCDSMDCSPPGSSIHGDSPGKNTGVGCHAFLQGIFPTQRSNPGLPHCKWILYHLSYQGSPL